MATNFEKYHVTITYFPPQLNGQKISNTGSSPSVSFNEPTYTDEYWVASMSEIKLSATGSSRAEAYLKLESFGDASQSSVEQVRLYNQVQPLSKTRTW